MRNTRHSLDSGHAEICGFTVGKFPHVIVADITMPGLDGIAAAGEILRKQPRARLVFVTVHHDAAMAQKGLAIGALGYVVKLRAGEELVPAIHAAPRGEPYVSPLVGGRHREGR
jgi:DNA-binding NarL/FixJ family response regulator